MKRNLARSAVAAEVGPHRSCCRSIDEETRALLLASLAQVGPLYALEKEGGFKRGDERGIAFATSRLAAGAAAVRDMIVAACLNASTPVGYPMVNVRDIEVGRCGRRGDCLASIERASTLHGPPGAGLGQALELARPRPRRRGPVCVVMDQGGWPPSRASWPTPTTCPTRRAVATSCRRRGCNL